jgi:hypothetical protein
MKCLKTSILKPGDEKIQLFETLRGSVVDIKIKETDWVRYQKSF